jgi:hypothetical protein
VLTLLRSMVSFPTAVRSTDSLLTMVTFAYEANFRILCQVSV